MKNMFDMNDFRIVTSIRCTNQDLALKKPTGPNIGTINVSQRFKYINSTNNFSIAYYFIGYISTLLLNNF